MKLKYCVKSLIVVILFCGATMSFAANNEPIYSPPSGSESTLLKAVEPLLKMSESEMLALVPPQHGIYFSPSPVSDKASQEHGLKWELGDGDKVRDIIVNRLLPDTEHPENKKIELKTPTGKTQIFRYYEDSAGQKYFFEMRRWFDQRAYMERAAYNFAALYRMNPQKYRKAGEYSVAIMKRFAEVYPDYIPTFDFPGRDVVFYPGNSDYTTPKQAPYRVAKWSWWAYMDISNNLLLAYDQLAGSDVISASDRKLIEGQLFDGMIDFVGMYRIKDEALHNMHPTIWRSKAIAANVLNKPELHDQVLEDMGRQLQTQFFYDGFWKEGAVSYHRQTVGGLRTVLHDLFPQKSTSELQKYLNEHFPTYLTASETTRGLIMPNGHYAALNDTWHYSKIEPATNESKPLLWPGMGYGILGMGADENQYQTHMKFSKRDGHTHYDSLNLILFAFGKELVSDLGYTHTIGRPLTISSVSHNTILVDQLNQSGGKSPHNAAGNLLLWSGADPQFQAMEVKVDDVYPNVTDFRRTLINVGDADNFRYTVDIFNVEGGKRHDWILHGSADDSQKIELIDAAQNKPLTMKSIPTLLPENVKFRIPKIESDTQTLTKDAWAYGFLRDVKEMQSSNTIKANYVFDGNAKDTGIGLQSWILPQGKSTFYTTKSWTGRDTRAKDGKEKDDLLNNNFRSSLIVRRDSDKSTFVAVHEPYKGNANIKDVQRLPWSDGIALKINTTQGIDYVLYQRENKKSSVKIDGKTLELNGRIALIQQRSGQAQTKIIRQNGSAANQLLNVQENNLTIAGKLSAAAGDIIIIEHGNGRTTPFHVKSVKASDGNTIISTEEQPVFEKNEDNVLKMKTFPFWEFPGEHTVKLFNVEVSK